MAHDFNIQDWQLGTDGVCAGMAATDAQLDGMLLDAALSVCMEFSKFAMAIGSTMAKLVGKLAESCRIITLKLRGINLYKTLVREKKCMQVCPA